MDVATLEGPRGVPSSESKLLVAEGGSDGSRAGFESLFLKHYPRVVGVLYRLVGDRGRAEELASDVFWKLHHQPWLSQSDGNVGGWLYRTATNLGIDQLRALGRRKQHEDLAARDLSEKACAADPLNALLRAERARRVRAALAKLKPAQARILVLRSSGLTYKELAKALGVRLGTVGTMLVRAETVFQKRYRQMYGKEDL